MARPPTRYEAAAPYHGAVVLTDRERQIVQLMANGLSKKMVARQLFVSETTVKTLAVSAYRRNDVHSMVHLVAVALRCGAIR